MNRIARVLLPLLLLSLVGCAASVKQQHSSGPLPIPAEAKRELSVSFKGNDKVRANEQWPNLQQMWRDALGRAANGAGYTVSNDGRLAIRIEVLNFRYMSSGTRYGLGVMAGNAWIDAIVSFEDRKTGRVYGTRQYNTSSSAWEGVFSAMTADQIEALSRTIVDEIRNAR